MVTDRVPLQLPAGNHPAAVTHSRSIQIRFDLDALFLDRAWQGVGPHIRNVAFVSRTGLAYGNRRRRFNRWSFRIFDGSSRRDRLGLLFRRRRQQAEFFQ
jgi:hypothetical protein